MKIKLINKEPAVIMCKAKLRIARPCHWVQCRNLECKDCPAHKIDNELDRKEAIKWWEKNVSR